MVVVAPPPCLIFGLDVDVILPPDSISPRENAQAHKEALCYEAAHQALKDLQWALPCWNV